MSVLKGLNKALKDMDKQSKELSVTELFLKEYDRIIEAINSAQSDKSATGRRKVWKPSSVSKCERNLYYYFRDKPAKFSAVKAKTWRTFGFGTAHHRWNQEDVLMQTFGIPDSKIEVILPQAYDGVLPEGTTIQERKDPLEWPLRKALAKLPLFNLQDRDANETTVDHAKIENFVCDLYANEILAVRDTEWKFFNEKFRISGLIDGAIRFNGKLYMWEYKTINPDDYKFLTDPLKKHLEQGAMYYLSLGIPDILFHYEDKAKHEYKVFHYHYEQRHIDWLIDKMERINECVAAQVPPPKTTETRECTYCEYKEVCAKGEK